MYYLRKYVLISKELWFRVFVVFFILVCPFSAFSGSVDVKEGLVSQKPTVCTVTINSSEEKEVFKSYLGDDFNFVELTQFATSGNDWFMEACQSGVECDILVISGHFGGSFFGSSSYSLSLSELQSRACQEVCDGLLKKPKEVFLFGCNTMAGKARDNRTPEEYTEVLIEDGFSRRRAEQVSAFRYSPLGEQTQDRMKQVFPYSRIYGFHSLAPSGKNIKPRLKSYFETIEDYLVHLDQFPTSKENKNWSSAMKGQWIRSTDGSNEIENPTCVLGEDKPIYKKLIWIDEVLSDEEKSLAYIPAIDIFLRDLIKRFGGWDFFPSEELSLLEWIQFNEKGRSKVDELLEAPIAGILSAQVSILNFGQTVGWYDREAYLQKFKVLISDIFRKNLDLEEKDLICSLGGTIDFSLEDLPEMTEGGLPNDDKVTIDLSLEDLPEERWNMYTIEALGCVKPASAEVHLALAKALEDPDAWVRASVAEALGKIKPASAEVHLALAKALEDPERRVRISVAEALGKIKPKSSKVHLALAKVLEDPNVRVRASVAKALGEIKPASAEVHLALAKALEDPERRVRISVAEALGKIKPKSSKVHLALAKALEDPDKWVRRSVAEALGEIKPASAEVHLALAKALEDPDAWVRASVAKALGEIKPASAEVHLALAKALEDPDKWVRASVAEALGKIKPQSSKVHLALAKALENPDAWVHSYAVEALGEIKPASAEVHLALAKALENPDKWVRRSVAEALGKIKPKSSKVHLALAKALEDPDAHVRAFVAEVLGEIKPASAEVHLALAKALEDPNKWVRISVAEALGKIKPKSSKVHLALAKALENPDARVRASVAEALNHLNSD